jgi:hypothetical protein
MLNQNKRKDVLIEIVHVVKQRSVELYIRETEKRWIIREATVLGDSRTYQLALQVAQQIDVVNLLVHKII